MRKWRTIGISIPIDSPMSGGKELIQLTRKYFDMLLSGKTKKEVRDDPNFIKWRDIIYG